MKQKADEAKAAKEAEERAKSEAYADAQARGT